MLRADRLTATEQKLALGAVDFERALEECAREPIHSPGATQPFGAVIIVDVASRITHVSQSVERFLGVPPPALLGGSTRDVLGGALEPLRVRAASLRGEGVVTLSLELAKSAFEVGAWRRADDAIVLSLLPAEPDGAAALGLVTDDLSALRRYLGETDSLAVLCQRVAAWLRHLSGYDRVMIYQFDPNGNGHVLSEALRDGLEPFLGLHYPATDIPPQARALYIRNRLRILGDTRALLDPLVACDVSAPPADLSLSLVRAHSPVHIQYLENMGVRATLTLSIVTSDGNLWGLVAFHHLSPRVPTPVVRLLSELVGEILAMRVRTQEELDHRLADADADAAHHDMVRLLVSSGSKWGEVVASPRAHPPLTALVPSGGAAYVCDGVVRALGATPPREAILALPGQLAERLERGMFHASSFHLFDALAGHGDTAAGVLAIQLGKAGNAWIFWFRPEQARHVTWAGRPEKDLVVEHGLARLSPRQSFAAWTEELRGHAEPWTLADLARARRVRESIVDVLLQIYANEATAAVTDLLRVRYACEASAQPIAVLDVAGVPIFRNGAWDSLVGSPEVQAGQPPSVAGRLGGPEVAAALARVIAGQAPNYVGESELAGDAGGVGVPVRVAIDCVRTVAGLPLGAVVMVTDRREALQAEEERRRLHALVDRAERFETLGLVTGTVAHDFNNLLTGILCETALLSEDIPGDSPQQEGLGQIARTARQAAEICGQLLAVSGKGTIVVRDTDVVALVRGTVLALRSIVPPRLTLTVVTDEVALWAALDAIQIRQVLMNLVLNASDASPEAGALVQIRVEVARLSKAAAFGSRTEALPAGEYVVVRVRDFGGGIDEDQRARIFEPFYTTKPSGKGLGLAMTVGVVKSHHGTVELESHPGKGSQFSVWLPRVPAHAHAEGARTKPRSAPSRTFTVLVVEDDPSVLAVARRILEREGYVVVARTTAASAREILADPTVDVALVFTDLALGDGSGRDVLRAASARDPRLPVILTSGRNDAVQPLSEATPNLVAFLAKPYGPTQLLEVVATALARP